MVSPYPFKGDDNILNYETFIGSAGTYNTRYIPTGETIPCVQPSSDNTPSFQGSGLDMLPLANLALGLLNLGVGVYNAFQLSNVQKDLVRNHEQIQAYFENIQDTLNAHQRTLEVLVCHQYDLSQQMKILREEMYLGFQQIVQEIQDTEARRRRKEFYANTHELLEVYERFVEHLPELSEADRLIDRAERLEALLQAELSLIDSGRPERLPLVVALSFSIRAKADAFEAKGGNYIASADKALNKLKEQIRREAYALCDQRSLYTLGVEMPEIVYQYALLNRSIAKGLELRLNAVSELMFFPEEVVWNDSLEDLRKIFASTQVDSSEETEKIDAKSPIYLKTLAEYDWYIRFADEDRLTFDVHSCKSIPLSDLLDKVGHPNPTSGLIYKSDLNRLLLLSLPESYDKFARCMQKEFSWKELPKLSGSLS